MFNPPSTYWDGMSIVIKYIAGKEGGLDKLKGKKIGFIFSTAAYGKEPMPLLHDFAKEYGFSSSFIRSPPRKCKTSRASGSAFAATNRTI